MDPTEPWLYDGNGLELIRYSHSNYEALKKSWDLLLRHLDDTQQQDLLGTGSFCVVAPDGQQLVVHANWSHVNIWDVVVPGESWPRGTLTRPRGWCTTPKVDIPLWDHILSQTLAIKLDWDYFREKAIRY